MKLLQRVLEPANMRRAWVEVSANEGVAGVDHETVAVWARDWEARLVALAEDVRGNRYRPAELRERPVPKASGDGLRLLRIPTVTDRVLQRAALQVLHLIMEPRFLPCSYGYRPGRGVADAVRAISRLRRQGYVWVLDADIDDFFNQVHHATLRAFLDVDLPDNSLLNLIDAWNKVDPLSPPMPGNLPLRRAQYHRDEDEAFCFRLAREIVAGKLRNQRTMVGRLARRPGSTVPAGAAARLTASINRAEAAADVGILRGIEGQAARVYFGAWRAALDPVWGFATRNRRPPRDPINALLSLGYSLLSQNMMTALEVVGLDPYLGYFHSEAYNRPALALDLVEEFRAPVVDSLVLWLANRRILRPEDFRPAEGGGVELTDRGLREFLSQFSGKLESVVLVRELERKLSYRKLFEVQARSLARCITGDMDNYRPFRGR